MIKVNSDLNLILSHGRLNNEYRFKFFKIDNYYVYISGYILNDDWKDLLSELLSSKKHNYENIVRSFQKKVDGDFVIIIFNDNFFLGFSDILGRLPFYFSKKENIITICLDFSEFTLNECNLNNHALIDYITYGFCFEEKTIFKEIEKLSCENYLTIENNYVKKTSLNWPFWWIEEDITLNEVISSIDKRKQKILNFFNNSQELICDLSGGFDSRLIFSLFKNEIPLLCFTQKYVQDESGLAKKLTEPLGIKHVILKTSHDFNENKIKKDLVESDCLVNPFTTAVCLDEQKEYLKHTDLTFRLMGFGGEFLRKPKKKYLFSKNFTLMHLFSEIPIFKLNFKKSIVNDYLKSRKILFHEINDKNKIKWFYLNYYVKLVVHAGEHRSRKHFFTVQPLFSPEVLSYYWGKSNKNKTSYKIFIKLISVFKGNLKIPFFGYGRSTKVNSFFWDVKNNFNEYLYLFRGLLRIKLLINFKNWLQNFSTTTNNKVLAKPNPKLIPFLINDKFSSKYYGKSMSDRLLGVNLYLNEIDENKL